MKTHTRRTRLTAKLLALQLACMGSMVFAAKPAADSDAQTEAQKVQEQRDIERAAIQAQRKQVQDRLTKDEAACYKQFVVDSCLREVRGKARTEETTLRNQELKLNEAERRQRAAERREIIQQKDENQREKIEAGQSRAEDAVSPEDRAENKAQEHQQRAQEAQQRADQQRTREAAHTDSLQKREASEPSQVQRARMQYEAKQQKAAERRAKHEKNLEEAAKSGKPPAAPLPVPTN